MAGGRIRNGSIVPENWNARLKGLAAIPNVYVKISMLYTLSGESPAPVAPEFYSAFIDRVVNVFGPNRVLYGSNWTLSELHGSYTDLVSIDDRYLEEKEILSPELFYKKNAIKAFGLEITR